MGCTFGSGVYVLIGDVIANYAGPSVIFSFIIAGLATFLAGMSYAELGELILTDYLYLHLNKKIL